MSDLASLLQVAPYAGAYQIGQAQLSEQELQKKRIQELAEIIRAKQQEYGQNEQMNPLRIAQQQNTNNYDTQVKLPKGLEDLSKDQMANQLTRETQPGVIGATNMKNSEEVGQGMQAKIQRIGTAVQSVPAPLRTQKLQEAMSAEGIDPSHPVARGMIQNLSQIDPNMWGQYFDKMSRTLGTYATNQSTQARSAENTAAQHLEGTKLTANAHVQAAKIMADSRLEAAKIRSQKAAQGILDNLKSGKVSPPNAAVQLDLLATLEEDPEKKQMYADLARKAERFVYNKNAAVGAGRPTIGPEGNLSTVPPPANVMGDGDNRLPAGASQKAAPKTGQTSSGAKYTIIPTN